MDKPRDESYAKQKRMRRVVAGTATAVVVGGITIWLATLSPAARAVERETVWIEPVRRGEMLRQVRGPGKLVAEEIQWIAAATDGLVERRLILPGTVVEADTVILELSNSELEQQELDAQLDLRAAEAESRDLAVRLESEFLNQQAETARVKAEHEEAKLDAEAQETLAKEGLTPEIDLKRARLRAQQLAERSQIEIERLQKKKESVEAQLASQRVRLDQLRALRDLRQNQVGLLQVRAGIAGVLQEVPVLAGQRVQPGTSLALVANPAVLKAELDIPQVQAKDLVIGQKSLVDTRNGVVEGRVKRIDPAVRDGSVKVDVELIGDLPKGARPDLSVEGTIEIERLENVLYVGRPASGQAESRIMLYRVQPDGIAIQVPVQLGRSSVNTIEIVEGLAEGDQVILSDTSAWDGEERIRLK